VSTTPQARLQQKKQAAVTTGSAGSTGIPCAMVLTVSFVLSPGTGLSCPRRQRDAKHHRQLDLSVGRPGPYDFAVRASHVRLTCHPRPSHPRLTCRDDRAYVPLHRGGMRGKIVPICPTPQAMMRAADWHDGQFAHGVHAGVACRADPSRGPLSTRSDQDVCRDVGGYSGPARLVPTTIASAFVFQID
jgi:hypothetical protein